MSNMKKCKHCKTEIDKKAKICPNCKKKQGGIGKFIIIGIVAIFIIAIATSGNDESNTSNTVDKANTPTAAADNSSTSNGNEKQEEETQKEATPTPIPEPEMTVYKSATYKVGSDIPSGEYVVFCDNGLLGYLEVANDSTGSLDSIIANENIDYNSIITLNDGEYFKMTGAYAVPIEEAGTLDVSGTGMFKVGVHLPAGEYKLEIIDDTLGFGYYEVDSDSSHVLDGIVTNENFEGTVYITVSDGQYLKLSNAKISQ